MTPFREYQLYKQFLSDCIPETSQKVPKDMFLKNDTWEEWMIEKLDLDYFIYRNTCFLTKNKYVRTAFKFYVLYMLTEGAWSMSTYFEAYRPLVRIAEEFINECYPDLNSLLIPDRKIILNAWHEYVVSKHPESAFRYRIALDGSKTTYHSLLYNLMDNMIDTLSEWTLTYSGSVWDSDLWTITKLADYGISYVKSTDHRKMNFKCIFNTSFRRIAKEYFKQRLLSGVNCTWGTAQTYLVTVSRFMNFYSDMYPERTGFEELDRDDIRMFIESMTGGKQTSKSIGQYVNFNLRIIRSFLTYIQVEEFEGAPQQNVRKLVRQEDFPSYRWSENFNDNRYVPEYVLCQLLKHAHTLPDDTKLIVLIMLNTGLRISDTLEITYEALCYHENTYWLEVPVIKTRIKKIQLPISDELADLIKERITEMKRRYAEKNNPNHYLFISGRKKNGLPVSQKKVQNDLNTLSTYAHICDKEGNKYHFRNHAFRHTFAVKCLNNGMDIITLQDFLGHASPEMTLVYAKLLDSTRKKIFKEVMKNEVFSFKEGSSLEKEDMGDISPETLERFWMSFKITAIDTPYGTCLQRSEGKCKFASQPPCLTCRGGEPCKDLCIGATPLDISKYEILIKSAESMVQLAERNNKDDMCQENKNLLNIYRNIYEKLADGGIIYGRPERIERLKEGISNG